MNPESAERQMPDGFSMVDLRDRVAIMLLFDRIVQEEQVKRAWHVWREMRAEGVREPLWRVLAAFPDVDSEMVYAEAARVYGFEEARITRGRALAFIQELHRQLDEKDWNEMVALRLLPVAKMEQHHSHKLRAVFATHDPARGEVQDLLRRLKQTSYELRYAPEGRLIDLLVEAFPGRKEYRELRSSRPLLPNEIEDYLHLSVPAEEVQVFSEGTKEPLQQAESVPGDASGRSLVQLFEDVLVQAIDRHATDVCLLPNAEGHVEIYFQVHKQLKRWRTISDVSADAFMAVIKREIVGLNRGENKETEKRVIRRWIHKKPVQFRVASLPPGDDLHSESIVIRVLQ